MIAVGLAAIVGFAAARALLARELPEDLPEPVQASLAAAQRRLRGWRALAREALEAGRLASEQAEHDLEADYRSRTRRV